MTSFRFDIGARSRQAGRLIGRVRRELLTALGEAKSSGLTQEELARRLNVRRADINRQFSGETNISLRSLADLAWALDRDVTIALLRPDRIVGQNIETSTVSYGEIKVIAPRAAGVSSAKPQAK